VLLAAGGLAAALLAVTQSRVTYVAVGPGSADGPAGVWIASPRGDWSRLGWQGLHPTSLTLAGTALLTTAAIAVLLTGRRRLKRSVAAAVSLSCTLTLVLVGRPPGTLGASVQGVTIERRWSTGANYAALTFLLAAAAAWLVTNQRKRPTVFRPTSS